MSYEGQGWGVWDAAALVAEIDRDLGEREVVYPELVKKGRIAEQEAAYRMSVIRDMRDDLTFAFRPLADGEIAGSWERADPRVTWCEKVAWINRELADRQDRFPELVKKGRMTKDEAERRLEAVEHLRRLYWDRMFQWQPPEGPAREYLAALRATTLAGGYDALARIRKSEGQQIYREHVRRHLAIVASERPDAQGRLVA
jgi:polyhydroxyalkanoate synthesis regulator phasin